ncbi:MAG: hypothetical protein FWH03_05220 [Firmicutes bacterium]|nr:hypothetical protein [Bacillota bacterium]
MARRRTVRTSRGSTGWLQLFSFIAIMLLALALMLSWLLMALGVGTHVAGLGWGAGFAGWLSRIAIAMALTVPMFLSYYEARRQGTVWFVLWVIAIILVVVFYVLGWFGRWW